MRKWLIHALIYLSLGGLVAGGVAYALGTNPAAVRGVVQDQLTQRFRHVSVSVERARLRLLGGVLVRELRMARSDGLDRRDFLYAPTAVIYHDKENVLNGQFAIKKVELSGPQIRLVRERDGGLNVAGILGPTDVSQALPLLVVRQGVVTLEDRACPGGPLLEVRDVQLTVVNDPLPTLAVEGTGRIDVLGPVRFSGTIDRATQAADLSVELTEVPVDAELASRVAQVCPEVGKHLAHLSGKGSLSARVRAGGDALRYEVKAGLRGGRFAHPTLPVALRDVRADVECRDGRVVLAKLDAAANEGRLAVRLADVPFPTADAPLDPLEVGSEMDVAVTDFVVTRKALDCLPRELKYLDEDFSPGGPITVRYRFRRPSPTSAVVKEWVIQPKGMTGSYEAFPYLVGDVWGTIRIDNSALPHRDITLDLRGKGGRSPVTLKGTIQGPRATSEVKLDIVGKDVRLDDRIDAALKAALVKLPRSYAVVREFLPLDSRKDLANHPVGTGHFAVEVRRAAGREKIDKRFLLTFDDCRVLYDHFPYPLEQVSGVLDLRGDGWECRDFRGTHKGGEFFLSARSERQPGPGEKDHVRVSVRGKDVLLDEDFEAALVPLRQTETYESRKALQATWKKFRAGGRLSFVSEVIDVPGKPQDVDVTVGVAGCTMRPTFFPYSLRDVSGTVRYAKNRVKATKMRARHEKAELAMESADVLLGAEGAYTAWLEGITGREIVPDAELLSSVPDALRKGAEAMAFRGPFDLRKMWLTVQAPPGGLLPLKFWWETDVAVRKAKFLVGVEASDVDGGFFCKGHFDGRQLRGCSGDFVVGKATLLNQPLEGVRGRMEIRPDTPDVVRFRDLRAGLFGGAVGGEARLDLAPLFRYDVRLEATNVQLDRFGKHNLGEAAKTAQLSGPARAAVHLTGEGAELAGLRGNGLVEVRQGKMGQLPVLLDLLKAFGLRIPDRTAFEQAELQFALEGPRAIVQQLDLYGNAVSLKGQGACDLDGSNLNLDFTAELGRLSQFLPAGFDLLSEAVSQRLYMIKMRGKMGQGGGLTFDQVPLPAVTEPLRRAMRN